MDDLDATLEPARKICREAGWPGIEEGSSYGTPAFKCKGKLLVRVREPGIVVLRCEIEEKEFLKQVAPDVYFETDHYRGYPAILARIDNMDPDELRDRLERTWRSVAPKKLVAEFERGSSAT